MLHVATILLCDTILFLILENVLERRNSVEDILIHFLQKPHWLVFVLFPWFGVLLWLLEPAKKLYRNNGRRYYDYQMLLNGAGLALMIIGACKADDGICTFGLLLCLWIWIGDVLVHHHDDGKQDGPDEPLPDSPTPMGDAAEVWLKELSRQPTDR